MLSGWVSSCSQKIIPKAQKEPQTAVTPFRGSIYYQGPLDLGRVLLVPDDAEAERVARAEDGEAEHHGGGLADHGGGAGVQRYKFPVVLLFS